MCAQFLIKTRISEIKRKFGIEITPEEYTRLFGKSLNPKLDEIGDLFSQPRVESDASLDPEIKERILPYQPALVVLKKDGILKLERMNFSLIPSWSKEKKVKFATHNARIETVAEKPTWKRPFAGNHVLVPLTHFIEPIYIGPLAGNMVQFFAEAPADESAEKGTNESMVGKTGQSADSSPIAEILCAAGIFDEWQDPKTGETIHSFSIVTTTPPEFIEKSGHDRSPIFLDSSQWENWLSPNPKDVEGSLNLLRAYGVQGKLNLHTRIDRPLAKGWEKRIPKE